MLLTEGTSLTVDQSEGGAVSSCLETLLPPGHIHVSAGGCALPHLWDSISIADSCMEGSVPAPAAYLFLVANVLELRNLLERASCNYNRWYPTVWTVVVFCTGYFSDHLPLHAFQTLWQYSVFNSAILIRQNNTVFRADPFAKGNRCGKQVVETFSANCSCYSYPERNLFPDCDFVVSARNSFPFSFLQDGVYLGSDVNLARLIASSSGLKIQWTSRPSPQSTKTGTEAHAYYENVSRNEIDLAIGGSVLNFNYFFNVTYGFSHATQYLLFYVADGKELRGWRLLVGMYSADLWSWILVAFILSVIALFFFRPNSLMKNILLVFGIAIEEPVRLPSGKLRVLMLSIIVPFHWLSFTYTTYLHSLTMNPPKICEFNSVKEIIRKNATVMLSGTNDLLARKVRARLVRQALANTIASPNLEESARLLDERKNFVLLERDLAMRFLLKKNEYRIHSIPYTVATLRLGLVLSKGSVFRERVQSVIVRCVESGLCDLWIKDLLGRVLRKGSSLTTRPIALSDVDSAFTILGIGLVMATVVFAMEKLIHKVTSQGNNGVVNNHDTVNVMEEKSLEV